MRRDPVASPSDPRAYEDYDFLAELVELAPPHRREKVRKRLRELCKKHKIAFPGCGSQGEASFARIDGANQEVVRAALMTTPLGRAILNERDGVPGGG